MFLSLQSKETVLAQSVALELIGKARDLAADLGEKVFAVLLGKGIASSAKKLVEYGADTVIVVDNDNLRDYITEQYTQAMYQVVVEYKPAILLFGATTIGRDLAPRVAARLSRSHQTVPNLRYRKIRRNFR